MYQGCTLSVMYPVWTHEWTSDSISANSRCSSAAASQFRTHGGKRPGAGRLPPGAAREREEHQPRPAIDPRHPLHVVIRARAGLKLRRRAGWLAVRHGLATTCRRADFRICHVSVQGNHVHLIVEADSHVALARGMQGFQIACARRFNLQTRRSGGVFADRYHPRPLRTPRETRNALAYVLPRKPEPKLADALVSPESRLLRVAVPARARPVRRYVWPGSPARAP